MTCDAVLWALGDEAVRSDSCAWSSQTCRNLGGSIPADPLPSLPTHYKDRDHNHRGFRQGEQR
jgi:hypothetical protein